MSDPFVTTAWLDSRLGVPNLAIVDGSWYLPAANRDPIAEYLAGHIPGAVFFDVDKIADTSLGLPHMLLPAADFAKAAGSLGIGDGMKIVVYDGDGLFSAPRVRWNFITMGAPDVVILEGGLPKWKAEGRLLETGAAHPHPKTFTPRFNSAAVADLDAVRSWTSEGGRLVIDARPGPRFRGEAPEPRAGVKSGHVPGAKSMPALSVVENGRLKPVEALRAQFAEAGIDLEKPIATMCGSGVTAATVKLALERAGAKDVVLYDGSWSEWGSRDDTDIATGP